MQIVLDKAVLAHKRQADDCIAELKARSQEREEMGMAKKRMQERIESLKETIRNIRENAPKKAVEDFLDQVNKDAAQKEAKERADKESHKRAPVECEDEEFKVCICAA
eukprot:9028812-Karenia_brevis.AAC.1